MKRPDETARFRYSEASIGFVAAIVSIFLLRSVGEKHARELLLTARFTPAAEAFRIGLINEMVAPGEHLLRAREVAREIALNSGISVRLSKKRTPDWRRKVEEMLTEGEGD